MAQAKTSRKAAETKKPETAAKKPGRSGKKAKKDTYFGELDQYLFGTATHYKLYEKMGCHLGVKDGKKGAWFVVWAPNALAIHVVGDFNNWDAAAAPMEKINEMGLFETFIPGVKTGSYYKYAITTPAEEVILKADPYACWSEKRPGNASRVADISYNWKDGVWMDSRKEFSIQSSPMAIYEVHPGSWMRHPDEFEDNPEGFYSYRELADSLVKYVKSMGYTHVELMGIAEHPFDGSWGYQVTGYYSPTSRYGTPKDFKYLVDAFHRKGIGVILDWVPAHFPRDAFGLADFDGLAVYEHADPRKGAHPDWGTKIFNYGRPQVKNFLIANALYWLEEFHVDGLRVDAVASMLYLDYGRQDGQWVANEYGGNENLEAIEFFRHLNSIIKERNPGTLMIAEESTAWPMVTGDPKDGGLGFSLKWNMGWMHDFLEYMKLDPYFRKYNHNKMTFSLTYAGSENYILVLSHDEVVHLKCSMINKMPGLGIDKFRNLMAGYSFMIGHPGKKLLFMGQEFGQYREWSEEREIDWFLLAEEPNKHLQDYVKELLKLYRKYPALSRDDGAEGFQWVNADDSYRSIYSFIRWDKEGRDGENLLFVINFTPMAREDYRCGVPKKAKYSLILNSADPKFGGEVPVKRRVYTSVAQDCDGMPYSIPYSLPPYGVAVFKF